MADEVLRDRSGRLLGTIRRLYDGRLEARDSRGRLRGTYDPRSNQTRDASGRLVGTGNQLASLLVCP